MEQANQPLLLQQALAAAEGPALLSLEVQLLALARRSGSAGFTLNDALLALQLPQGGDSRMVRDQIQTLLLQHLLDVDNDERGRVIYREP